jgi:hypothetical protein
MGEDYFLSLHAISGRPQHKAIQLRALARNQALAILVDSGSSHIFLSSIVASKLQVVATTISPMAVKVANGASLPCSVEVRNFEWWVQGHTFQVDANIIDMSAYDLVLGLDWLQHFSPMLCDWLEKWMEFQYKWETVRLQRILPSHPQKIIEVSMEHSTGKRAMICGQPSYWSPLPSHQLSQMSIYSMGFLLRLRILYWNMMIFSKHHLPCLHQGFMIMHLLASPYSTCEL